MIQPRTFVLTINRQIKRFDDTVEHLESIGINWERFEGMDNTVCRLNPVDTFDLDRVGERIGPKHIAATLTHYLLWKTMLYQPDESFWALEFDARFVDGWRDQCEEAMSVLPDDWDVLFLGSCCTSGREQTHIGKNLYEVHWPLCNHAMMYRKKALPTLLDAHQRISAPLDIAMTLQSLPKLRTYCVIPRLVEQSDGTYLPV